MLDKILNYIKDTHPTYNQIISFFGIDNEIINKNLLELEEQGFIDKIKNIPSEVHQEDLINREDYRDHLIVTFNGSTLKG